MVPRYSIALALFTLIHSLFASAADKNAWRTRSIYQVMVDRFARPDNSTTAPCNVTERAYCGGTWKGLMYHLDYIQGMGFDAVWISPISAGVDGMTGDGSDYTGYWVNDLNSLNENFGTEDDLLALSNEMHNRGTPLGVGLTLGMYLMLDIVVNNMAYSGNPTDVNYRSISPLNKQEYFHPYCPIDFTNRTSTLYVPPHGDGTDAVLDGRHDLGPPGCQHGKCTSAEYNHEVDPVNCIAVYQTI